MQDWPCGRNVIMYKHRCASRTFRLISELHHENVSSPELFGSSGVMRANGPLPEHSQALWSEFHFARMWLCKGGPTVAYNPNSRCGVISLFHYRLGQPGGPNATGAFDPVLGTRCSVYITVQIKVYGDMRDRIYPGYMLVNIAEMWSLEEKEKKWARIEPTTQIGPGRLAN